MRQGKVKWYNGKKCYGFVAPDTANDGGNQDDVFIHASELKTADIRFLNEGDTITFDDEMRGGKLSATNIKLVKRDEESARKFQERRSQFREQGGDHYGYERRDRRDSRDSRDSRDGGDKKSGWGFWKK